METSGGAKTEKEDGSPEGHAVLVEVHWSDGLHHRWNFRLAESVWDLEITMPGHPTLRVTDYTRDDMERVLGTALKKTKPGLDFGGDVFSPGINPMTLTKDGMLALLGDLRSWIDGDDSMEGVLAYEWHPELPGQYRVAGVLRMGNSMGQGGVRLLRGDQGEKAT